jgi:hypothetical protein
MPIMTTTLNAQSRDQVTANKLRNAERRIAKLKAASMVRAADLMARAAKDAARAATLTNDPDDAEVTRFIEARAAQLNAAAIAYRQDLGIDAEEPESIIA